MRWVIVVLSLFSTPAAAATGPTIAAINVNCVSGCSAGASGTGAANVTSTGTTVNNASGALQVTSTGTVIAGVATVSISSSVTVTPGTGTWAVSGTFYQGTQPVSIVGGALAVVSTGIVTVSISSSVTVTPGTGTWTVGGSVNSVPTVTSFTVVFASGSFSNPFYVLSTAPPVGTLTVTPGTGTWTVGSHAVTNAGTFATQATVNNTAGALQATSTGTTVNNVSGALAVTSTGTTISGVASVIISSTTGALSVTSTNTIIGGVAAVWISSASGALNVISTAVTPSGISIGVRVSTGFATHDVRDTGRTIFIATGAAAGVTTEAIMTLVPIRDFVAGVAATSLGVTANKRLRLTSWCCTWRNNTAVAGGVSCALRGMPTGATTALSPVLGYLNASTSLATIGSGTTACEAFPDGIDLTGSMTFGVSRLAVGAVVGATVTVRGYEW